MVEVLFCGFLAIAVLAFVYWHLLRSNLDAVTVANAERIATRRDVLHMATDYGFDPSKY